MEIIKINLIIKVSFSLTFRPHQKKRTICPMESRTFPELFPELLFPGHPTCPPQDCKGPEHECSWVAVMRCEVCSPTSLHTRTARKAILSTWDHLGKDA